MHYSFELDVLASNTADNPAILRVNLGAGILEHIGILFRAGCDCLVKARVYQGAEQIAPTNPSGYYAFDNYIVEGNYHVPFDSGNNEFTLYAWADGAHHQHTLRFLFDVRDPEELTPAESFQVIAKSLSEFVDYVRMRL